MEDWAYELLQEDLERVPEALRRYVDVAAYARDLELGGEINAINTQGDEVHIVWAR